MHSAGILPANRCANGQAIRPSALSRYRAVDPTLEETLGPPIERLIHGVLSIEALVKEEQHPARETKAR